jgi:hypothetical protein
MNSLQVFDDSFRWGRILRLALDEILGHDEVTTLLKLSDHPDHIDRYPCLIRDIKFSFENAGRLQAALECSYGHRAGRGLSMRVGRACLKYSLQKYGDELGLTDLTFRLLPLSRRLKLGSETLAGWFNQFTDQRVRLEVDDRRIQWHIEHCSLCGERRSDDPCCALAVGFMQEALSWLSGGKYYQVVDKNSIACDDGTCTIVIDQTPIV